MNYLLGVDGGGTKTDAVVATSDGEVIGTVQAGTSNFQRVGKDGIKKVITEILKQLKIKFDIIPKQIGFWALGLAGAGREEDQIAVCEAVESSGFKNRVAVQSDAYIALLGAFGGQPGIIVISGTGSICFGLDENGELFRSGGWGYLLGDEGSGYFIGHQSVLAALKDQDGRGKKTILRGKIESELGLSSIDQIVREIYIKNSIQKEQIANLAPIAFQCAEMGDVTALEIITQTAVEISEMIKAVGKKMNRENRNVEIAHIGSVFKQKEFLVPEIKNRLKPFFKDIIIDEPKFSPAIGGIIMALKKTGAPISEGVLSNLRKK